MKRLDGEFVKDEGDEKGLKKPVKTPDAQADDAQAEEPDSPRYWPYVPPEHL